MRMLRKSLLVALALTMVAPAQAWAQGTPRPGVPPRDTAVAKPGTGRIRGRVLAADTNMPLRRAQVTVTAGQLGVRRFITTDEDGRYEIVELAEGRYTVTASKGGYVTLQFGQRRAFEPGRPVAVAEGQDVSQVDIVLPRGSVITGRITDEFGEPIAGAQIEVQRYQYGPSGRRRLTYAGGSGLVFTDDRGEFRAYGLMPGEYVVSGIVRRPMFQQSQNPNDAPEGYAPTYYPGTPNPAEAQLVDVGLGQEVSIQMALQATRMARISGTVVDSEGKPLVGARLMVRSASGDRGMFGAGGSAGANGAFTLTNVPPGEHYIEVVTDRRRNDAGEFASMPVSVGSQDISNVRIITGRAATVTGTVVFEGSSPRSGVSGGLRVTAQPADPQANGPMVGMGDTGRVEADGRFALRGVGSVFFRAINLGPWMLKQVTIDGEDITDTPYELGVATSVEGLRVVLTDRITDISGGVTNERGQALNEFVVVIQPARDIAPPALARFLRTARPDQDGRFGVRGIPPGEYVATAVEVLEQGREWDGEYRQQLRDAGQRFAVRDGESVPLDLQLASGL